METESDLHHNIMTNASPAPSATPYGVANRERDVPVATSPATPYGVVDGYGLPRHSLGLALMPGDMIAAVFTALIILGPLFAGATHAG